MDHKIPEEPGKDPVPCGYNLIPFIKKKSKNTLIIGISSYEDQKEEPDYRFIKPFSPDELKKFLREILQNLNP